SLRASRADLRSVYFRKSAAVKIIPERSYQPLLDPEFRPFPDIAQGYGPEIQFRLQGRIQFPLVHSERHGLRRPGKLLDLLKMKFSFVGSPFFFTQSTPYAEAHSFFQLTEGKIYTA